MKFNMMLKGSAVAISCALLFSGCNEMNSDTGNEPAVPLTVDKVNELVSATAFIGSANTMTCKTNTNAVGGCFQSASCTKSSDYFSTRTAYSVEPGAIKAFEINYSSPDCSGEPKASTSSWSKWNLQLSNVDTKAGTADAAVTLVSYTDGYLFDSNKPNMLTTYHSAIKVDRSTGSPRLCLSTPLIDPNRPLKFMDVTAKPLDEKNCAVALN